MRAAALMSWASSDSRGRVLLGVVLAEQQDDRGQQRPYLGVDALKNTCVVLIDRESDSPVKEGNADLIPP